VASGGRKAADLPPFLLCFASPLPCLLSSALVSNSSNNNKKETSRPLPFFISHIQTPSTIIVESRPPWPAASSSKSRLLRRPTLSFLFFARPGINKQFASCCSDYLFKLLLIGDSSVGKSCLLLRFAVSFPPQISVWFLRITDWVRRTRLLLLLTKAASFDFDPCIHRMIRSLTPTSVPSALISSVHPLSLSLLYTALRLYSLFLDHQLTAIVSRNFINPLFVLANALLFRKSALSTSMERLSSYRL